MGQGDGVPHRPQPLALARRNEVNGRKFEERQARFDLTLHLFALVVVHRVPLVHGDDDGPTTLQDVACDVGVLVGHALGGIEQQQDHMR